MRLAGIPKAEITESFFRKIMIPLEKNAEDVILRQFI